MKRSSFFIFLLTPLFHTYSIEWKHIIPMVTLSGGVILLNTSKKPEDISQTLGNSALIVSGILFNTIYRDDKERAYAIGTVILTTVIAEGLQSRFLKETFHIKNPMYNSLMTLVAMTAPRTIHSYMKA